MRNTATNTRRIWRGLPSWQRLLLLLVAFAGGLVQLGGSSAAPGDPPSVIGDWSAPTPWPIVAVHMSLTPTGEVFALDGFEAAVNSERLWNPTTNTFRSVPYGRNLFCSGHIQLGDGRTLLVGGHVSAYAGLKDTTLYDAQTNTYVRGADMAEARWYPTVTQLPDGRVLAFAGDRIQQDRPGQAPAFTDASVNSLPELYNPATNTWTSLPSGELTSPLYPYLFVLSDGRIANVGPDTVTRVLTPGSWTWSTIGTSPFDGQSAVMYRPDKIMKSGAWADPDFQGSLAYNAHGRTAVIDMSGPSPSWRETAAMHHGRSYHNLTLLPDGTVLASGGESASDGRDLSKSVLPAEIWNPDTETWTEVDALQNGRLYHSAALLLPDGRVLMAGGGAIGGGANQLDAEIYSPPYLFKGTRPTITSAPASTGYGASFAVTTPNAAAISKVSLVRLPSVTHAIDMNQRFQFLDFTVGSGSLTVTAPANANLAPPGDYMLFVVDTNGVPSVASFVRISSAGDTTPPTAPSSLTATAGTGQVALGWGASSDASGVARYDVHRSTTAGFTPSDGNRIAQPTGTSYTDTGLTGGTYYYRVTAVDVIGNVSAPSNETSATVAGGAPSGLVAAWGFDEASGTSAGDGSGGGHTGTLSGATWTTTAKYGAALDFDGANDLVSVADAAALDLTTGMTVEAWVRPTALGGDWRTVLMKEASGSLAYTLYANGGDGGTKLPRGEIYSGGYRDASGTSALQANTWTHLATTFDGAMLRLYVNGSQAGQLAHTGSITTTTGALRIGGNNVWAEWFQGQIDEVRVYNRALTPTEIQGDMTRPVTNPDTSAPSAPGTLAATGGLGHVALSWGAASDANGVVRYNMHRSTTAGFTPGSTNRIAQPTGTSYTDTGLAAATYYYRVTAEDAGGNVGPPSNEASGTATADTTPPTVSVTSPTGGSIVNGTVSVAASASDGGSIAGVQFRLDDANLGAEDTTSPYSVGWDTYAAANGGHTLTAVARDAAGNTTTSAPVSVTVENTQPQGLVAAWGMDEGAGTSTADQSGNGHTGTLSGATWTTAGKYGAAVSFDGVNDLVSVADAAGLDLTTGMTLEAWVRPSLLGGSWRTTLMKEATGSLAYGLYANGGDGGTKVPTGEIYSGGYRIATASSAIAANTWTHIATTYDGSVLAVYVNGTQTGQLLYTGSITTTTGALKIGGNNVWAEWFQGQIDEVRVYNRALTATQIQGDMSRPVTNPDTTAPSAPGSLTATGGLTSAQLAWTASTDNTGVTLYNVHRGTSAGFTPSTSNRISQVTTTSHTDAVAAGIYYYKVTAQDAAGNVGAPSNEASATVGDTTAPTAPGTLTASGGVGKASLNWGAATDNVGVIRYNVHRSTTAGFTPSGSNRIAQPSGTTYQDTTAPGTYYYRVTAEDAAGSVGPASNEASASVLADTTAPSTPSSLAGTVTGSTVDLTWTASTDDVGVARYNVHRSTTAGFTPSPANRIAQPTGTSYSNSGLAAGIYYYRVTAEDAAVNVSGMSNEHTATVADATPPTPPGSVTATATGSTINVAWTAASDNIGVVRYNVHRSQTAAFTPSVLNRIAQPTGTSYADTGRAPGTYYYKVAAEDAAGNVGPASTEASATVVDTSAPSAPSALSATGGPGQTALGWTAATDNVGVVRYNVHRSTTAGFTPSGSTRIAQPTGTSYTDTSLAAGTYHYKVTAEDAAGNVGQPSNEATATVSPAPVVGLVAAYGFDEGSGTTTTDQSGGGNTGTLSGATWTGAGRFGSAIAFDGVNDLVNVADASSLDLTNGMTLQAWVRPSAVGNAWRTAIMKEQPGGLVYSLYAAGTGGTKVPLSEIYIGGFRSAAGSSVLPTGTWTHLATTYDGSVLALFVNGIQVGQSLVTGSMAASTGILRIGGNTIWGEYFQGDIDEIRIFNRARTSSEIQSDMATSISSPDTTSPSAPGTLSATGSLGTAALTWGAATDNVGVARYNLHRSTSAGFTASSGNRIAQPNGTGYTDTGLAAGTYHYKVTAEDAAGNVGPASNEASALVTADTTPPTVSISSPSVGSTVSGFVTVSANASDNGTLAGVQFKVDGANLGAEDTTAPYSVTWDTFTAGNGSHALSAVARDAAGNATAAANVGVTVSNTASAGLVGAWALDEGSGATTADQSGRGNTGTISNTTWTTSGKFNAALSFNGTNAWVSVPDSSSLDLTTGMTLQAWVRPSANGGWRTAMLKEQSGNLVYGLYSNTSSDRPAVEVFVNGSLRTLSGSSQLPTGVWSHLASTFDGTTLRLFVNGTQVGQLAASGSLQTSSGALRIGGNSIWGEWFNGPIDEVRVYNRALSASEIQADMNRSITPDTTAPTVVARTPVPGSAGLNVGTAATTRFSEPMNGGSITTTTFQLRDAANALVPATVSYDPATATATLTPQAALEYGVTYTATVDGGTGGVTDLAGNVLAADSTWTFTTEASPPPILIVGSTANPFGLYLGEILRNEGMHAFTTVDVAFLSPALLAQFDVVLLGQTALNATQVTTISDWVNGGGNLIAMRPDKQLAGLLGLTDAGSTLSNAYLQVNTATTPGAGIVGSTMQFHGVADRYSPNSATSIATLYTTATTATSSPAVTLRSVGSNGGQAAAFTFDLARSVVLTRQGNPAWAGQERDGASGLRPSDMFYGARVGDVQPDWIDTSKIAIPQADEQQRLLLNLITVTARDRLPVPRFWYLPRGEKAVVVMSGDDHSPTQAPGGTASHFDRYKALSPAGCSVAAWECVRSTSYVYDDATLTNAQAAGYQSEGFEVALHPIVTACPTTSISAEELGAIFDTQLARFQAKYTSVSPPVSSRTHCVYWPDWVSNAKVELARGIRLDANYYHYPGSWVGARPGFMNGGGFPMRFADLDGTLIDVYQQNTNLTDESTTDFRASAEALLDNALGAPGYYGAFGANMHTDNAAPHPGAEAIVAAALARSVPVISYKQLLTWVDGRNASTIRGLSWSGGALTFVTTVGAGATGLQTMLPVEGPAGTVTAITRSGTPVPYTIQTIKGIQYAMFDAATATYQATYA